MDNSEEAILIINNNIITYVNDTFLSFFASAIQDLGSINLDEINLSSELEEQP